MLEDLRKLLHTHRNFKNLGAIELGSLDDFAKVPLTTRADLELFRYQDCPEAPKWIRNTSGSSGSESLFYFSVQAARNWGVRVAAALRHMGVADMTMLTLIEDMTQGWFLVDLPGPNFFHAISGGNWSRELAIAKVESVRPQALMAPPPMAVEIMQGVRDRDFLEVLLTGGTVIPETFKKRLRGITGAELRLMYVTTEFGILANQATDGQEPLRLNEQGVHVEVLGDDRATHDVGTGTLVVTDLHNYSSPLIRYVTDDRVVITRQGEHRFVEVYGRGGEFVNLAGSVTDKAHLLFLITKALGTDEFRLEVDCDPTSLTDFLRLKINADSPSTENLCREIGEMYEVRVDVGELEGPIRRFGRGKADNFTDLRRKD